MQFFTALLPVTVVAAIALFVIRETIEAYRRYKSDNRKKAALKKLLARECERNHASIRSLTEASNWLKEVGEENEFNLKFRVYFTPSGHLRFCRRIGDEEGESSFILRPAQQENMGRLMVEVANLDARLFGLLEAAYDAVAEVRHIRDSMIDYLSEDADADRDAILEGFAPYALGELQTALEKISRLYRECTGRELRELKLR